MSEFNFMDAAKNLFGLNKAAGKIVGRKINNAYDAWWFLHEHPAFMLRERHRVAASAHDSWVTEGFLLTKDKNGVCWREYRHLHRHALEHNLSVHYAKVDSAGYATGKMDANIVECWLEFGQLTWDYMSEWEDETSLMHYHDPQLDCGGATFDEALIKLAKLVLTHYGDYEDMPWKDRCAKECGDVSPCADCRDAKRSAERMGLATPDSDAGAPPEETNP